MSRFSGRDETEDEFVDVQVKAFLNMSVFYPGIQANLARIVLVEDARSEAGENGPAETFIGRDGETGQRIEITVSYPGE